MNDGELLPEGVYRTAMANHVCVYRWIEGRKIIGVGKTVAAAIADMERVVEMTQRVINSRSGDDEIADGKP